MTCSTKLMVVSFVEIGDTKEGPGLGKYYEGLGYVEVPLRSGDI